jgi:hypothetical protein
LTSSPATSANRPITTPETVPITGPVIAIIRRGEPGIDCIIAISRAWLTA